MTISTSQYAQMIFAAIGGIAFFLMLYRLPEKRSLGFLLLLIPFQLIDTRYGTVNTVLIYVAAFTFFLQGRLTKLPFFGPMLLVLFAFMLAFSQSLPIARIYHVIYMVGFFTNILLFYMVFNYILRSQDWQLIIRCLLWVNAAVLVYCAIQFFSGSNRVVFFGIDEFSLNPIRNDGRLVGPFKATAATAEYLTFQCMILVYLMLHNPTKFLRRVIIGMVAANFLFLIATGNRGGFVTILLGLLLFLLAFRREFGLERVVKITVAGVTLFTVIWIIAVNYTDYVMLF
jgi:hypothetical protein